MQRECDGQGAAGAALPAGARETGMSCGRWDDSGWQIRMWFAFQHPIKRAENVPIPQLVRGSASGWSRQGPRCGRERDPRDCKSRLDLSPEPCTGVCAACKEGKVPTWLCRAGKSGEGKSLTVFFRENLALPAPESRLWCDTRNLLLRWEQAEIKPSVMTFSEGAGKAPGTSLSISLDFLWGGMLGKPPGHPAWEMGSAFPVYPSIVPGWTAHPCIS